jgi:titin
LAVSGFPGGGIELEGSDDTVAGSFIGTNASGNGALPNGGDGVLIDSGASGNTIGGTTAAARNIISGNTGRGINLNGSGNVVQGNYIGTDATGTLALGNGGTGIGINGNNNLIGGTTPGAGNVVSANAATSGFGGIVLGDANTGALTTTGNIVQGNLVGTDYTGTRIIDPNGHPLGNGNSGVNVGSDAGVTNNIIGGTAPGAGNIIAGTFNTTPAPGYPFAPGIALIASTNTVVEGNFIGTDRTGTLHLGNLGGAFTSQTPPATRLAARRPVLAIPSPSTRATG